MERLDIVPGGDFDNREMSGAGYDGVWIAGAIRRHHLTAIRSDGAAHHDRRQYNVLWW